MLPVVSAAGDRALLVELGPVAPAELHGRAAAVRARPDVVACIPGEQSLYIVFAGRRPEEFTMPSAADASWNPRQHRIEVGFAPADALDLPEFLARFALSRDAFLQRLAQLTLTARYLGFRAGFAYLDGWPEEWRMPRRPTSRLRVPGGSFAIAAAMAGFYPVDSPGGWNILGRTAAKLWDAEREPPNLIAAGDVVRIEPRDEPVVAPRAPEPRHALPGTPVIAEVVSPGQLTMIVGARDWSLVEHGIPPGGPFDESAAAKANRAAGNPAGTPLLECVFIAPRLRFRQRAKAAWCAPDGAVEAFSAEEGTEIDPGRITGGLRGYLAIEGGIDPMCARYAEAPAIVRRGDVLALWRGRGGDDAGEGDGRNDRLTIRILAGPHQAPPLPESWIVTPQLNRVGIRLRPAAGAAPALPKDLPSCGMQCGTLQWHADGSLVAMGPDHPVTGGYLQPATVISADLWKLAQLAPGDRVRLVAV